jgi:hypothetical protein
MVTNRAIKIRNEAGQSVNAKMTWNASHMIEPPPC